MDIHQVYAVVSRRFRSRRMCRMQSVMKLHPEATVLDVGGTRAIWAILPERPRIVFLNLLPPAKTQDSMQDVIGDACRLPFKDKAFDVVFSNSLIEHLHTLERQQTFADECRRVGRQYFVQAPNQRFFLEPHLLTPLIHWLPKRLQARLLRNFTVFGWITRPTPQQCRDFVEEVRMPVARQMRQLFPDGHIRHERVFGLSKSLPGNKGGVTRSCTHLLGRMTQDRRSSAPGTGGFPSARDGQRL